MGEFVELLRCAVSLLQDFPPQQTITAAENTAAALVKGLEAVLSDGLRDGASMWDFVEHSQHSMFEQNPQAEPQVADVEEIASQTSWCSSSLWKGRMWILRSLTTHTIKDALHSLTTFYATDIRQSYFHPWAFLHSPDGLQFVRDVGRMVHVMRFHFTASDLHLFDPCNIPCMFPCHGTRWGHRGDACPQCGILFRRMYPKARCEMCRLKHCSECLSCEVDMQDWGPLRVCATCFKFSPRAKRALKQQDPQQLHDTLRLDGMLSTPPTKFLTRGPTLSISHGSAATVCMRCQQHFSPHTPDSHACICCKGVFCDTCSTHLGAGPWELLGVFLSSRVCMTCYDKYQVGQPDTCAKCRQPFAGRPQHPCCNCRRIFCDPCAPRRLPVHSELFGNSIPMRLCDACHDKNIPDPGPYHQSTDSRPPSLTMIDSISLSRLSAATTLQSATPFSTRPGPVIPVEEVAPGGEYLDKVFFILEDPPAIAQEEEGEDDLSQRLLYFFPSCIVRPTRLLIAGMVQQINAVCSSTLLQPTSSCPSSSAQKSDSEDQEPCIVRLQSTALVVGRIGDLRVAFGARAEFPDSVLLSHFTMLRQAVTLFFGPTAFAYGSHAPAEFHARVPQIASTLCSLLAEYLHHTNPLRALQPVMRWPMSPDLQAQVEQCVLKCKAGLNWTAAALFLDEFVLWADLPNCILSLLVTVLRPKASYAEMYCTPKSNDMIPVDEPEDTSSHCSSDSEPGVQKNRQRPRSTTSLSSFSSPPNADTMDTGEGLDTAKHWLHSAMERTLFCKVWPSFGLTQKQGTNGVQSCTSPPSTPASPFSPHRSSAQPPEQPMGLYVYSHGRMTLVLLSPSSGFNPVYTNLQLTHNRLLLALRRVLVDGDCTKQATSSERRTNGDCRALSPSGHLTPRTPVSQSNGYLPLSPREARQWQVTDQHVSSQEQQGSHSLVQAVMHHDMADRSIRYFGVVDLPFLDSSVLADSLLQSHQNGCSLLLHRKRRPVVFAQTRETVHSICLIDGLEHDVAKSENDKGPRGKDDAPRRRGVIELAEAATARAFDTMFRPSTSPAKLSYM